MTDNTNNTENNIEAAEAEVVKEPKTNKLTGALKSAGTWISEHKGGIAKVGGLVALGVGAIALAAFASRDPELESDDYDDDPDAELPTPTFDLNELESTGSATLRDEAGNDITTVKPVKSDEEPSTEE